MIYGSLNFTGDPGAIRTRDPQLRRLLLYPTELRAEIERKRNGRGERIRTFDPLVPNQMRYQTALRSDKPAILMRYRGKS